MSLALILVAGTGCGLHLHRPNDAKQSRAIVDGFNQLKLDSALKTARTNVATLTAEEIETRRQMGELLVRRDALSVVVFQPVEPSDQSVARGWPKLRQESDAAVRKYELFVGMPPTLDVPKLRLLTRRRDNIDNLARERRVFESLVKTYTSTGKPAPTCEAPPSNEIELACERIRKAEAEVGGSEMLLCRDSAYASVASEIGSLEEELKQTDAKEKQLAEVYANAKKKLTDAQEQLAKDPAKTESEAEAKRVDNIKKDIADATKALNAAVEASKSTPLVASLLKNDLLTEIIANAKFLSGDTQAPAQEVTKKFVEALNLYPDVAGRLKAAADPSTNVNVYLLEAALQRLNYRMLVEERTAKRNIVAILKGKRDAMVEVAIAWVGIVETLHRAEFTQALSDRLQKETVASVLKADDKGAPAVKAAVIGYLSAKLIEDVDLATFDIKLADLYYRMSLDFSAVALEARNDLVRAPLQEITVYHEGGIRAEEVAAFLQAAGVAGVAAGVNR